MLPQGSVGRNVTGHTFRVTGARHLAAKGVDVHLIMLMARWRSNIVMRYAREAPLEKSRMLT
eukprot:5686327-Amphidinium_carterae.1